jgi:hypothetical protein
LLSRVGISATFEEVETLSQALEELRGGEDDCAGGGEFEREREIVEPTTELLGIAVAGEGRVKCTGPGPKELDPVLGVHRLDRIQLLPLDLESLSTGHKKDGPLGSKETSDIRGDLRQQVLGIVEEKEKALVREHRRDDSRVA